MGEPVYCWCSSMNSTASEAHDQLDQVERIGIEVLDERGLGLNLLVVDAELLDDDLLEAFVRGPVCHEFRFLHPMIWKRFLTRR
jgi:hypothetical protein